ncbi:uncharacterized protein LOC112324715 [Populus trichocarpa]|uniref:uncharacterized protein LOC112324715 n=1 Tax=Populus trichocarpa TaxID=3694 RepID=UPI000D18A331|nr:uncharacterized protein LOC112324715 [Populus trichocarpa]|eukprot:XP_024444651.1 uncharacterized protein LOC112324715 [Populus trichocarpa]
MANAHTENDSQSFNDTNPKNKYLNFSDPFNPFRIENGDNPAAALVSELLTADNYVSWSRAISRALRAKNKLAFVNGTLSKPTDISDPLFEAWERCNDLVVSWLQNSVLFISTRRHSFCSQQDSPDIYMFRFHEMVHFMATPAWLKRVKTERCGSISISRRINGGSIFLG